MVFFYACKIICIKASITFCIFVWYTGHESLHIIVGNTVNKITPCDGLLASPLLQLLWCTVSVNLFPVCPGVQQNIDACPVMNEW